MPYHLNWHTILYLHASSIFIRFFFFFMLKYRCEKPKRRSLFPISPRLFNFLFAAEQIKCDQPPLFCTHPQFSQEKKKRKKTSGALSILSPVSRVRLSQQFFNFIYFPWRKKKLYREILERDNMKNKQQPESKTKNLGTIVRVCHTKQIQPVVKLWTVHWFF